MLRYFYSVTYYYYYTSGYGEVEYMIQQKPEVRSTEIQTPIYL